MNPQASEREELPARDRRWVEALRAHAPDGPPPALDASVLAAARAAVGAPAASTGRGGKPPRWLAAVAGVMVVLSAGVLVRQVAQETAPKPEPELPSAVPGSAAEERAAAAMQATREAEGLPARETVEAAPAAAAPSEPSAKADAADRAEPAIRPQAFQAESARAGAPPPPPPESPAFESMPSIPEATPLSAPAPAAPPAPIDEVTVSGSRIRSASTESASPTTALSEPPIQAKSASAAVAQRAEAGPEETPVLGAATELPESELLALVRRRLAAGDRDTARTLLMRWRERHPAVELPAELEALLASGAGETP